MPLIGKSETEVYERHELIAAIKNKIARWLQGFKTSDFNLHVPFLNIKDYPINELKKFVLDRIIVRYKDGNFEVLPKGIEGIQIRSYLGYRYHRITHWGILPSNSSKHSRAVTRDSFVPASETCTNLYDLVLEHHEREHHRSGGES